MADFADEATQISEMNLQIALENSRATARPVQFTGICRNCYEHVDAGAFCDKECRTDYHKRLTFKR